MFDISPLIKKGNDPMAEKTSHTELTIIKPSLFVIYFLVFPVKILEIIPRDSAKPIVIKNSDELVS